MEAVSHSDFNFEKDDSSETLNLSYHDFHLLFP